MNHPLSTQGLTIGHGAKVLIEGMDLDFRAGELVALIGVNGGGKSTLLRTMAGLHTPLGGSVRAEGHDLAHLSAAERARRIAVVLTGRPQAGLLDVRTIVALGRQPWTGHFGYSRAADQRSVEEAMQALDVQGFATRSLQQLSDGEAQRVMVARALAQDTPVMLLDEPMAFLDLVNRVRLLRTLRDLARTRGKAIVLSTHDLQTALDLCDRMLLLHDRRAWVGTTAEARTSGILQRVFNAEGLLFDPRSGGFHPDH